jgi:NAD(P)-dependent dehydrogenase (short-subunit alcohol dehydrogenase family)
VVTGAAIVTGGASGIGLALGRALAERGHHLVLADIDADGAAAAAEAIARRGVATAEGVALDVADAAAVADLVERTHREHGRLDYMCNNAGIGVAGEPEELTLQHWERCIDVNLRGVLHGCHAAYPVLQQQGSGHIVNTASLAGLAAGLGLNGPYNLTKYGVVGLSLTLRAAGADHGVKVHALCPGVIDTPILDRTDMPGLPMTPGVAGVHFREFLRANGFGRPYPADRLAADALRGMARNRGLIIAPRQARIGWLVLRSSPRLADALARTMTRRWRAHPRVAQTAAPPH